MVNVIPEKCIGCNACIRACPVPTANRYDGKVVHINNSECIQCGECVKHCLHGARDYEDDIERLIKDMRRGNVSLIVAPAIRTAFDNGRWKGVLAWLKSEGVNEIYDVSFGADICTYLHLEYVQKHPDAKIISQPCAAIVNYVEKHKPALIDSLSPIHSPMLCSAVYVQKYLHNTDTLVGLSPCIAKGDEFENTGIIKYNVTFRKLAEYIKKNNIRINSNEQFEFSDVKGFDGAYYPIPGGLKECLKVHAPTLSVTTSEGVQKVYEDLETYLKTSKSYLPTVYDVLSCEYGCNSGVGAKEQFDAFQAYTTMTQIKDWAFSQSKKLRFPMKVLKSLNMTDFLRSYKDRKNRSSYTESDLNKVFLSMEKYTVADREVNCHACGYKTCKDMATAILHGYNVPTNCIMYEKVKTHELQKKAEAEHRELKTAVDEITLALQSLQDKVIPIAAHTDENQGKNDVVAGEMNGLNDKIKEIIESVKGISEAVVGITNDVSSYQKILEQITDISEQTNILAINASIEAARAGDAGKGFAVVAGEVRNLAQKSNDTVKQAEHHTENMIASINSINEAATKISEKTSETRGAAENTKTILNEVNEGSKNIASNVQEISAIVEELNATAETLASNSSYGKQYSESVGVNTTAFTFDNDNKY